MEEILSTLEKYLQERGWDHHDPPNLAKSIVIEGAELMELFQWTHLTTSEVRQDAQLMRELKDELADVLIYCLELAINLRIDPAQIMRNKIARSSCKYPATLVRHDPHLSTYLEIKKNHRGKTPKNLR